MIILPIIGGRVSEVESGGDGCFVSSRGLSLKASIKSLQPSGSKYPRFMKSAPYLQKCSSCLPHKNKSQSLENQGNSPTTSSKLQGNSPDRIDQRGQALNSHLQPVAGLNRTHPARR